MAPQLIHRYLAAWGSILGLLPVGEGITGTADAMELHAAIIELEPWGMIRDDRVDGIHPAIMREIERRTGYQIHLDLMPYARVEQELVDGDVDFADLLWSDDRLPYVVRGERITDLELGVLLRHGVVSGRSALRLAGTRGMRLPDLGTSKLFQVDVVVDHANSLRMAVADRVDGVIGSLLTLDYTARKLSLSPLFGIRLVLTNTPVCIQYASSRFNAQSAAHIDEAIIAMQDDGTIQAIIDAFFRDVRLEATGVRRVAAQR